MTLFHKNRRCLRNCDRLSGTFFPALPLLIIDDSLKVFLSIDFQLFFTRNKFENPIKRKKKLSGLFKNIIIRKIKYSYARNQPYKSGG